MESVFACEASAYENLLMGPMGLGKILGYINDKMWGPRSIAKLGLTNHSNFTMVYGTYSYSYWGESKPTWPHCNELWPWLKLLEVGAPDWLCFFATWKFELWGTTSYLTMTPLGQLTGLRFVVVPSGKHTKSYWKLQFIVGLPMKHDDFPWLRYYQRVINSWSCFLPLGFDHSSRVLHH